MSFRSKQPVAPARRRSSSAVRNSNSSGNTPLSSYTSRPRSTGYYAGNTNSYYSPASAISSNGYSSSSSYNPFFSGYTSNYKSPYFQNGYRSGNLAGYASLTIPAKALANVNVVTSSYSKSYDNKRDYIKQDNGGHRSRQMSRAGSFTRDRSLSKSRTPSLSSGMGSRSMSLTSLNSEGYIVRDCT